jgi:hypothetical protein
MVRDISSMMKGLNISTKKDKVGKNVKSKKEQKLTSTNIDDMAGLFDKLTISSRSDMDELTGMLTGLAVSDIHKITRKMKNPIMRQAVRSKVAVLPSQRGQKSSVMSKKQLDDIFAQAKRAKRSSPKQKSFGMDSMMDEIYGMEIDDELDAVFDDMFGGKKRRRSSKTKRKNSRSKSKSKKKSKKSKKKSKKSKKKQTGGSRTKPPLRRMTARSLKKKSIPKKYIMGARGTSGKKKVMRLENAIQKALEQRVQKIRSAPTKVSAPTTAERKEYRKIKDSIDKMKRRTRRKTKGVSKKPTLRRK